MILLLAGSPEVLAGGGVRGNVKAEDGSPLGYATLYVKQTNTGIICDLQGHFDIPLAPGFYDIVFQYLGYETATRTVEVGAEYKDLEITLKSQVMVLPTVDINAKAEDPAYTIMRKAIAKANYHIQQIDKYSAKVYIKGKGKLKDS